MEVAESLIDKYEDILDELRDTERGFEDVAGIYRSMLFGWSKLDPTAAQGYLIDMVEQGMEPDNMCFNRIIEANTELNDDDALVRTKQVFDLLEECQRAGTIRPNERLYTSYIRALTKARVDNLPQQAMTVLSRMHELAKHNSEMKPTVFTYNAMLMACAAASEITGCDPREAFKLSVTSFNEIRKLGPDHVSFGNMLRCAKLVEDGEKKDALIRSTFGMCCQKGFVNSFVIRDLQDLASEELWRDLLHCPQGAFDMDNIRPEWQHGFEFLRR
jgi:hypothetical protein